MTGTTRALLAALTLVSAAGIAGAYYLNQRAEAAHAARQAAERELLEAEGALVARSATIRELEDLSESLRADILHLSETALVKPQAYARIVSDPFSLSVSPPTGDTPSGGDEPEPVGKDCPSSKTGASPPLFCPCPPDAVFEARAEILDMETREGNHVLLGRGEIWRLEPPPELRLATFGFDADASSYLRLEEPRHPEWLAGPAISLGTEGLEVGLAVTGPAWRPRVLGWQPEIRPVFTATGGSEGGRVTAALVGSL